MKTRAVLLVAAVIVALAPIASPVAASPDAPTTSMVPPGSQIVSSGQVTINVSGSPQTFNYQVYRRAGIYLTSGVLGLTGGITAQSTSEYICGITVTNQFGGYLGKLEQHIFASFSSTSPVGWTLSSGNTQTDAAGWCCYWSNVTNPPYASGGYGSTNTSNTTIANGDLHYYFSPSGWHTKIDFFTSGFPPTGGWSCSGGSGRLSPPG
jgi:hypothetical protein